MKTLNSVLFFNKKIAIVLVAVMGIMLSACDNNNDAPDDNDAPGATNNPPSLADINFTVQSGTTKIQALPAQDADGDSLSYTITTAPGHGTASISGLIITFVANNEIASDTMVLTVSDGVHQASLNINITLQADAIFDFQFYSVVNPETGNKQIVRYDPNDPNPDTNQQVIKNNVILGDRVFVMSGVKQGDKTVYIKREYGIFLDPNASFETRTADDGQGGVFEYAFYTDHILKAFDAVVTANERVIFEGNSLSPALQAAGLNVIDSTSIMFLNEVDINNSYVELNAYDRLFDSIKGETIEQVLHQPIAVRLSDSAHTPGRIVAIIKSAVGSTDHVLVNYIAAHKKGAYPADPTLKKRLQVCGVALASCTDVAGGAGNYFYLGRNDTYVYLAKNGSNTIYAYNNLTRVLAAVTGVTYPAEFDNEHHLLSFPGYGRAGVLSSFVNMGMINHAVAEGNTTYLAINYDLDLDTPVGQFFRRDFAMYKHAMILKLTGTTGKKVFDNGDGIDHMNASDTHDTTLKEHVSLTAVKDGHLFLELATYTAATAFGGTCITGPMGDNCTNLRQGWLDTNSGTFPKSDIDNTLGRLTGLRFLMGNRIPPVAMGEHIYFSMWDTNSDTSSFSGKKFYDVYKMPLNLPMAPLPATPTAQGRMYFERTAFRSSGIFEGNILLWHAASGEVTNITTGVVLGVDSEIETTPDSIVNVIAKSSSEIVAGVGGLFGLRMSTGHAGTPYLVSGESATGGSLKTVNHIRGRWITD